MFRIESTVRKSVRFAVMATLGLWLAAPAATAQDRLGGHFGMVFPLVSHVNGETTGINEDFKIGFPMGITVKTSDEFAFDLELVPTLDPQEDNPINVPLTVHPGVLMSLGNSWTGGLRMAFDIGDASWGFTPLINKSFPVDDGQAVFVEFVVPIRFQDDSVGDTHTGITFGVHVGFGF